MKIMIRRIIPFIVFYMRQVLLNITALYSVLHWIAFYLFCFIYSVYICYESIEKSISLTSWSSKKNTTEINELSLAFKASYL